MTHWGRRRHRVRLGTLSTLAVKQDCIKADEVKLEISTEITGYNRQTGCEVFKVHRNAKQPKMQTWQEVQSVWQHQAADRMGHSLLCDVTVHQGVGRKDRVASQLSKNRARLSSAICEQCLLGS